MLQKREGSYIYFSVVSPKKRMGSHFPSLPVFLSLKMDIQKKIVFLFLPFFCIGISFPVHAVINEEELEALVERTVLGQEGSFKPTTSLTNEAYDTTPVTAKDTKAPEAKTTHGTAPQEETERIEDVVARMYKN